jgi:hypothetical protein
MIKVDSTSKTIFEGIGKMIDAMVVDYSKGNTNERMFNEYKDGFKTIVGQKFIKITNGNGVKAFIVKEDNGKFKMGDILKPASWRAPAKNSARGNVLEGGYAIQWTGPLYLR